MDDLDGRIKVLSVQDGDVLIFRTAIPATPEIAHRIQGIFRDSLAKAGAPLVPVMVIDQNSDIEILRAVPGKSPFITREELPAALQDLAQRTG